MILVWAGCDLLVFIGFVLAEMMAFDGHVYYFVPKPVIALAILLGPLTIAFVAIAGIAKFFYSGVRDVFFSD